MQIEQFLADNHWLIALSLITLPIKAFALWKAAKLSHKIWFIVLFATSTFGIVDILYILLVARRYKVETRESAVELRGEGKSR
jgi:hypothetical protein